jgi:hypothetical protein
VRVISEELLVDELSNSSVFFISNGWFNWSTKSVKPSGTYDLRIISQKMVGNDRGKFPSVRKEICRYPACKPSNGRTRWPINFPVSS